MSLDLTKPVGELKGVGESLAKKLARLNIFTIEDLLKHYPRRYDDFSTVIPINKMRPGNVTFRGEIAAITSRRSQRQRRLTVQEAIITDGTGTIKAIWFNQPWLKVDYPVGAEVMVAGKLEFKHNDLALQSPIIEKAEKGYQNTGRIIAIYPETEGLSSKQLRSLIRPLLPELDDLPESLPPEIVQTNRLMPSSEATRQVHLPYNATKLAKARHRLAFEELFYLIAASLVIRREIQTERARQVKFNKTIAKRFIDSLDFKLTDSQRRSAWEILQDLDRSLPMNRLLEGDVGSGKTVVAAMAAIMTIQAGHQVALMVPTEILARQHLAKLEPLLEKLGYSTELRVGGRSKTKPTQAHLTIGTQALISGGMEFDQLGLVIIDEQHRFGVNQRLALKQKAGYLPHLLSMTATPIPRSLALTIYGDLDISVIDELPPGRKPILTKVIKDSTSRKRMYELVDGQIAAGHQVFVVCPLIDDSDKLAARSVTSEIERLQKTIFKHRKLAGLHGQMKLDERSSVMAKFVSGEVDILVATSMVEVGVDIPNASVMVVEDADRFGLAALHQLRGRVGRGAEQSYCFLVSESNQPLAAQRIAALEHSQDGFRLAQIDLELRGPGQIYGLAQHGILDLKIGDISNTKLIREVRKAAESFLQNPRTLLEYPQVTNRINQLKAVTSLD